jgi:hypothetical protein
LPAYTGKQASAEGHDIKCPSNAAIEARRR